MGEKTPETEEKPDKWGIPRPLAGGLIDLDMKNFEECR